MSKPWWLTDSYTQDTAVPDVFVDRAGPNGLALVRSWPSGMTDPGWGLQGPPGKEGFMPRYNRGEFNARRALYGYNQGKWAFAFIMRSVNVVSIDIDGKNGGFDHAKKLGKLPATLAETSKSGNGYHLFYLTHDVWDPQTGFGRLGDRIGIEQGVDVRATGCIYHYDSQRWNDRPMVALPNHLSDLMLAREQKIASNNARIDSIMASSDDLEILMLHDEILSKLAAPIPTGKRNVTLFALGNQMRQAQIDDWEGKLSDRATQVGLDADEVDKLVRNIAQYGSPLVP